MSTSSTFSLLNRSVSPYAEIVVNPDNDSEKCAYKEPRKIASAIDDQLSKLIICV